MRMSAGGPCVPGSLKLLSSRYVHMQGVVTLVTLVEPSTIGIKIFDG